MDFFRSGSARQRAARYLEQANKLRHIAETEPVERIRKLLLATAEQYQELAAGLSGENRPIRGQRTPQGGR
jgi:hypothetical protein